MTNPNPATRSRRPADRSANTPAPQAPQQQAQPFVKPVGGLDAIKALLMAKKDAVTRVIPAGVEVTAEGLIQNAIQIIADDRHLRLCSPKSALYAVLAAAKLGLDLVGDQCFLIPFSLKDAEGRHREWSCNLMPGYRGYVTVAGRFGYFLDGHPVHANDFIDFDLGGNKVTHKPPFVNRGELVGSYCVVRDAQNQVRHIAMVSQEEITQLQQDTPAWRFWKPRMVMKCAVKRAFNLIPKSHSTMRLLDEVDRRAEKNERIDDLVGAEAD